MSQTLFDLAAGIDEDPVAGFCSAGAPGADRDQRDKEGKAPLI